MQPNHLSRTSSFRAPSSKQNGAALIIALVLLVIMTLLGLSALRGVSLEEKMSGQTYDRSISFQSTEAALREAEAWVAANKPVVAADTCSSGVCGPQTTTSGDRWLDSSISWSTASEVESASISLTPQYLIEYLGNTFPCQPMNLSSSSSSNTCKRYRITARSNAGDDRANVMLQSIFGTE